MSHDTPAIFELAARCVFAFRATNGFSAVSITNASSSDRTAASARAFFALQLFSRPVPAKSRQRKSTRATSRIAACAGCERK